MLVQPHSSRGGAETYIAGQGDVLLAYENEAISAKAAGAEVDYFIPDLTILIENPIAVTAATAFPVQSQEFVDFLRAPNPSACLPTSGSAPSWPRSPSSTPGPTPRRPGSFTIADLGTWMIHDKFFHPSNGIIAQVQDRGD